MKKITLIILSIIAFQFGNAQDTCLTAIAAVSGTNTVAAVDGTDIPLPECAANAGGARAAGEWYTYTATVDGRLNVTTDLPANAGGDTRLHIYSGTCAALVCIGGNDDVDGTNYLSDATADVTNGTTYYIAWDDRWDPSGFDFVITETACTATNAPGAATAPTPAIAATGVAIVGGAGVAFSWVEDATGDVADTFDISIGLTATGDDIGTLADVTNGGVINFAAANNTMYFWKIDAVNCVGSTASAIWNFTTEVCAETAIPVCTTPISPADGDLAAAIGAGMSVTFTWDDTDPTITSYELFINGFSQGVRASGITFTGFAFSTAYTWSVVPSNCFGAANAILCPTWNFTTAATLGLNDFEVNTFSHFYNKETNELNLESSNEALTNVELYNLLGQQVMAKNLSQTTETLNLSGLTDGIYIAKVGIGANTQTIKFIKQ